MYELVDRADVFIHNFRPGTPARLGIDYDTLIARNPRLVYVYGSCFGSNGPWSRKAGFHSSPNAISGAGIIEAGEDNNPINRTYADPASALGTAAAVMIGLEARERTGRGQYVETVMLTSMAYAVSEWGVSWDGKRDRSIDRSMLGFHALHRLYPTADGFLNLAATSGKNFKTLCKLIDREKMANDPRFATMALRGRNREALNEMIAGALRAKTSQEWFEMLVEAGLPCGPVYSIRDTFADPQVETLRIKRPVKHPRLGDIDLIAQPCEMTGFDRAIRAATPDLGQHNDEVLRSLGYDTEAIAGMKAKQVI